MKHMWVEHRITSIEPELNEDTGQIDIFTTEGQEEIAGETLQHSCGICNTMLTVDTLDGECTEARDAAESLR